MKIRPCFSEPRESYCEKIKVELDLSSYATKSDLKEQLVLIHLIWQENQI